MYTYREESGYTENLQAAALEDARREARALLAEGDWGQSGLKKTTYVEARIFDTDGQRAATVQVRLDPPEPECESEDGHDWQTPHEVVGGVEENPGVWGKGGGIIATEVCSHCGRYRVTDTWDQSQGPEPAETVRYAEADDDSEAWVRRINAKSRLRALIDEHGQEVVAATLRSIEDDENAYIDGELDVRAHGEWLSDETAAGRADEIEQILE